MKGITMICALGVLACAVASPADHYTDRFDNINIDDILNNPRLLNAYINCVLDKGKCTSEGKELKSHISDALENHCEKCTEKQRQGTRTVLAYLINNKPATWNQLTAKSIPMEICRSV
uniref:Chemosensory protein 18 n=1 Tax=Spodoptera exigua TaxID=7107 RepID=A0A0K1DDI9_SPOEX|nr:chemosensory protein 18 [Spodoptera exigua]